MGLIPFLLWDRDDSWQIWIPKPSVEKQRILSVSRFIFPLKKIKINNFFKQAGSREKKGSNPVKSG